MYIYIYVTGCGLCIYKYIFNPWGAQICSAGSNLAVYIVGAMQLMQGIIMTKHKGFLSVEPLCHHMCVCVHVYVRIVRYI